MQHHFTILANRYSHKTPTSKEQQPRKHAGALSTFSSLLRKKNARENSATQSNRLTETKNYLKGLKNTNQYSYIVLSSKAYIKRSNSQNRSTSITALELEIEGEKVGITYHLEAAPFDRIRRITGYLVGTLDRFNDAKRAEERNRVKHDIA